MNVGRLWSISIWLCCPSTSTLLHISMHFPTSSKTVLFLVCFGLPLLVLHGIESSACFWMDSFPFPRVWLNNFYFLIIICSTIDLSLVASHSSVVLLIMLGHLMPILIDKPWLPNIYYCWSSSVNSAIHSTQKRLIMQIKHSCNQQHATLHDASRTLNVTYIYIMDTSSSSSHTVESSAQCLYP